MPGRLLYFSVRKLDVYDYCLNGDRCMAAVCPAPGESQPRACCQSWLGGQAERGNLLFFIFSNMTNSFFFFFFKLSIRIVWALGNSTSPLRVPFHHLQVPQGPDLWIGRGPPVMLEDKIGL